jgi:hypothetical protein
MSSPSWVRLTPLLGVLLVGCFDAPVDPAGDCRRMGTCECAGKADCPEPLWCIDGRCALPSDRGDGRLGSLCTGPEHCQSGLCLPPGPGRTSVCTVACAQDAPCPGTWECKQAEGFADPDGGGSLGLCVPPYNALCLPCAKDTDCNAVGDRCLQVGGAWVCGRDCTLTPCPSGYECQELSGQDGGVEARQCVPLAGSCECSDLTAGMGRACKASAGSATCYGFELCQADGSWAGCDAPTPSQEVCNGRDDDCDGLIDADDPDVDTSMLPATPAYPSCRNGDAGACVGTWACAEQDGEYGWFCNAVPPRQELCNGLDEDCNGLIDEPFLTPEGQYGTLEHCGACGYDCTVAVANLRLGPDGRVQAGAVACEVRAGAPTCAPLRCAVGFAPYPTHAPVMCLRAVTSACRTCADDLDCGPFGDRCVVMGTDPGTWCAQRCDAAAPYPGCTGQLGAQGCCPSGYACQARGSERLCIPQGDSCTCNPEREGAERACLLSTPSRTCVGLQTCGPHSAWSACDTSRTTVEVCDGVDNNCDGVIDEPFVNTRGSGTWDTDEQCGSCQTNCRAMWNPAIQHAIGGCNAGPTTPPTCGIVACTQEAIAGGGACRLDSDCGAGRTCHPLYRQCVRACGTDAHCGTGGLCSNGLCTRACTSDGQCQQAFGSPSTCRVGRCEVLYQFVDTDKEPTNGCECPRAVGVVDEPDLYPTYPAAGAPYVDRDCDGVDGVAALSLFVRAGAGGNGSRTSPFGTLAQAIAAFNPQSHSAILVAAGNYLEQVVLKNGVKLYGGYSADFSHRDVVANPTVVESAQPDFTGPHLRGTVNAEGITQPTVLAGFTVRGYDVTFRPAAGAPGRNSYAVYVKNSGAALRLANNHIIGGRGGDAAQGAPGGAGGNGTSGADGRNSKECLTASCSGESQPGGVSGVNASCAVSNGNPGAASSGNASPQAYQPPLGRNGRGGSNGQYFHPTGTDPSLCKYDCQVSEGMDGQAAQNGTDGTASSGGTGCGQPEGVLQGDEWTALVGGGGADGFNGSGGGGGGGGGIVTNLTPSSCTVGNRVGDLGGTGGGGGAGGCGGKSGKGGGGGGGSFGVFIVFTQTPSGVPLLEGNIVDPGRGGGGGNGGPGGYGGAGGAGGVGGIATLPAWCAGKGGSGGRGGSGGAGGGGGGGCGGASWGIAGNFIDSAGYLSRNQVTAAASAAASPGAGGASPAGSTSAGSAGVTGAVGTLKSF